MAEELTTFYAGYIERPLVACEALSVFLTQKAVEDTFEVGDREFTGWWSAAVEGLLRDHQFTERERKPEDTWLLGFLRETSSQ